MGDIINIFTLNEDYAKYIDKVKQIEAELNIKFVGEEFFKMLVLLIDPDFTVKLD
jgi:hypothetical protein